MRSAKRKHEVHVVLDEQRSVTSRGNSASTPKSSALSPAGMPARARRAAGSRARRQRERDLDQPLLAVREIARELVALARQMQRLQQRVGFVGTLALLRDGPMPDAGVPWRSHIGEHDRLQHGQPGNSVLIWNVRVMPRLTRSCCDSAVMLSSPRKTRPPWAETRRSAG
jgi:hypothetical protein